MPLIKQALWNPEVSAIHRLRKLRRRGDPNSMAKFQAILKGMEEVDPKSQKALAIAEELSKTKIKKSPR